MSKETASASASSWSDRFIFWFTCIIVIAIFRVPIAASISQLWLTPILAVIPMLFVCILLSRKVLQEGLSSVPYKLVIGLMAFFFVVYLGLTFAELGSVAVYKLSAVTVFLIFPLACYLLFDERTLTCLFEAVLKIGIVVAFVITLVEFLVIKSGIASPQAIHFWMTGEHAHYKIRINTFMGLGAISGLISFCGYAYFLAQYALKLNPSGGRSMAPVLVGISLVTLFLDDSFLLIVGAIIVTFVIFWIALRDAIGESRLLLIGIAVAWVEIIHGDIARRPFDLSMGAIFLAFLILYIALQGTKRGSQLFLTGSAVAWGGIIFAALKFTPIYDRFGAYFFRGEIYSAARRWLPDFSGCSLPNLLTGIPGGSDITNVCRPGELHGLTMVIENGLLVYIPWFLFFASPILIYTMLPKKLRRVSLPIMAGCFAFIFPFLHYSGVEMWGNNYLFAILVVLLFHMVRKPIFRQKTSSVEIDAQGSSGHFN